LTRLREADAQVPDGPWRAAEIVGVYQAPTLDFPAAPDRDSYLKILVARLA